MPTIRVYHSGVTAGIPPMKNDHKRAVRSDVTGWSSKSARNQTKWLYSVEVNELSGYGLAFTFTVRDCPSDAKSWTSIRRAFLKRLERAGLVRYHWLTEWQRRGVPHLHGCAYFDFDKLSQKTTYPPNFLVDHWLSVAGKYGPAGHCQKVNEITDMQGWLKYLAKHASRGIKHYQRQNVNVPEGWQGKTGRMWGKTGEWPDDRQYQFSVSDNKGFWVFRRLVRSWRKAYARDNNVNWIPGARTMLKCPDKAFSQVRGVSEWINRDLSISMLTVVGSMGFDVRQI